MATFRKVIIDTGNWVNLSTNRKIFASATIIAVLSLLVKLVAMGKDMLVASLFGTTDALDAFFIAFLLPQLFINIIAASFVSSLVPVLIRTVEKNGEHRAKALVEEAILLAVLMLVAVAFLLVLSMPLILPVIASGFSAEKIQLTRELYYLLIPLLVVSGVSVFYTGILNSENSFAIPALLPILTPLCIFLILLLYVDLTGIFGLVWGMLLGALLELIVLAIFLLRSGWSLIPRWHGMMAETRTLLGQYTPMIAGAFIMSGTVFVDQAMAAMQASGSVSALNYGNKLLSVLLGIGAMALGTAVLPHFSRMVVNDDWINVRATLSRYVKIVLWISIPVTALFIFCSEWIVAVIFERGVFTKSDTKLVALIQMFYALQIPFYLLAILGLKLINALHKNQVLFYIAIVNLLVNIIGNLILVRLIGIGGIALSTSIVSALSCTLVYLFLAKVK